ncbi:MAG: hypothetical protein A2X05_13190 [Bacteroidetes bacterium GWE2_41_25]|nr:MAG: hypothetical protein A2X03_15550 [Bacteroidetes bacterium GWA2_40_15]OFX86859.1 MAG: hypothetical protein A2X06_14515 [Bacteroidetes bacterium GWC2_40_22]OFY11233.1 MAG: hypothetical protein A2X05_13190 [Bacteroidetes bacterium GWE2_41_25]OFY57408.1 MAG: hypothetical protein A2X04_04485 [Bacteroidetes bacterium GWF2_41_9]HAM11194.1 hypothetical protein [Bacteroidales bacterium]
MKISFVIQKGDIIFEDELIRINDRKFKWERFTTLVFGIAAIVFAIMTLIDYFESDGSSEFGIITFAIIFGLGVPSLVYRCKLNYSGELKYSEITKVIIHENPLGLLIADFILASSKKRHVVLDMNRECNFERSSLTGFVKELKDRNIETEEK